MRARAISPAAVDGPADWRGSYRPRPPRVRSVNPSGSRARVAAPSPVISNAAVGGAAGAAAVRRRRANRDRCRARASSPDHPERDHRNGRREGPCRSAAATAVPTRRGETRRRRHRHPARHPIRIGAGGAAVVVEGAVLALAVRRVRAVVRGLADVSRRPEFAGIEWTSGALA